MRRSAAIFPSEEESKGLYDPCPVGWRVPDGGSTGVWSTAFNQTTTWKTTGNWDGTHKGMDFGKTDKKLVGAGSGQCWYPAAGCIIHVDGKLSDVGDNGCCWSCTTYNENAYGCDFGYNNEVYPSSKNDRAYGHSVRCLKEK